MNEKFCENRCELKCKHEGRMSGDGGDREKSSERKISVFPSKTWDKKGKRKDFI